MSLSITHIKFVGEGNQCELERDGRTKIHPWIPGEDRPPQLDESAPDHPSGYFASRDLVDAVNTALILHKPLLLTGNPGAGKSQLAERIAWEFNISPVLRFEAQSLSEATDLFYRFDLVRQVAESHLAKPSESGKPSNVDARDFLSFGALGKAIMRSNPSAEEHIGFWPRAFSKMQQPATGIPSVVLIDEIDKASRDFPNDLLNAIERLEVPIREIPNAKLRVTPIDALRPIIIITSNSERELPAPFLRRCLYFHITDPSPEALRQIVRARVFPETRKGGAPTWMTGEKLPDVYEEMLQFFVQQRDEKKNVLGYASGPSELIDWARAVRENLPGNDAPAGGLKANESVVTRAISAFVKHREDRRQMLDILKNRFGISAA